MEQKISAAATMELFAVDSEQPFSKSLYNALAHCMLSVAVEVVTLRVRDGHVEVFLKRRANDDSAYPGMLHVPGTVIRVKDVDGEHTYKNAIGRAAQSECGAQVLDFEYINEHFKHEPRGRFNCRVFLVRFLGEPTGGEWSSVEALPADVIAEHAAFVIPIAVRRFKERFNID